MAISRKLFQAERTAVPKALLWGLPECLQNSEEVSIRCLSHAAAHPLSTSFALAFALAFPLCPDAAAALTSAVLYALASCPRASGCWDMGCWRVDLKMQEGELCGANP